MNGGTSAPAPAGSAERYNRDDFITVPEGARRLSISERQAYRLMRMKLLSRGVKLNGSRRVRWGDWADAMAALGGAK